jgi:hypothetical protein
MFYGKACFLFYYALPAVIRSKSSLIAFGMWQIGSLWQISLQPTPQLI